MSHPSLARCGRAITCGGILAVVGPSLVHAQTSDFTACTTVSIANCAAIQLTEGTYGDGPGGSTLFEIAVQNLGGGPSLATSIYSLIFSTGADPELSGGNDNQVTPTAVGGATVTDATPWDLFDSGDYIFLETSLGAPAANGVGGCLVGGAVGDGFGDFYDQAGQTGCGSNDFLSFSFYASEQFDPTQFTLADMEVVGLTDDLPAASCGPGDPYGPCTTPPTTSTPEPGTVLLMATGLLGLAAPAARRRWPARHPAIATSMAGR